MWVRMCGVQWERGVWEKGVKWFWGCDITFGGFGWGIKGEVVKVLV